MGNIFFEESTTFQICIEDNIFKYTHTYIISLNLDLTMYKDSFEKILIRTPSILFETSNRITHIVYYIIINVWTS